MTELEKVIKALECCVEKLDTVTDKTHGFNCTACPYFKRCDSSGYLIGLPLMKDALLMLKAQEPRVMTLSEALRADWCFVEIRKYLHGGDLFYYDTFSGILVENSGVYMIHKRGTTAYVDVDRYGIDWRCWTSRPTDAQREATPWEGRLTQ